MNVLLISQCHKNALKETRRIIDQFAERTGERSWQTEITEKGLEGLHKLLRKTARKNTAIACHWIRSKNHTELLWIVGDKSQFNERGRVPTNSTKRNILKQSDECKLASATDIQITAVLAGLLHDLGKSSIHFQNKLKKSLKIADEYRHEWWSIRLFQLMINGCKTDQDWLERLTDWKSYLEKNPNWFKELKKEAEPSMRKNSCDFSNLPPLAKLIAWLISSHHRMPISDLGTLKPTDFQRKRQDDIFSIDKWFESLTPTEKWVYNSKSKTMEDEINIKQDPTISEKWQKDMSRWAKKALCRIKERKFFAINENGDLSQLIKDHLFSHLARLCLIVGDHYFSSQKYDCENQKKYQSQLWANCYKDFKANLKAKQLLDEHLCGVANSAKNFARAFLWAEKPFAYLEQSKSLAKPVKNEEKTKNFLWQNEAFDLAKSMQEDSKKYGFFAINSASTGSGKTLANAKILYALSENDGTRITIALGLRTLTLQTGAMLRDKLKLKDYELASLIGSPAVKALFDKDNETEENKKDKDENNKYYGSESEAENYYLDENEFFDENRYESPYSEELLTYLHADNKVKTLLDTPIISCTIDHLMQISEQKRGGRFAAPMLRLFSSDIVLDEPDDFSIDDLPALTRLVYWIGMLGGRLVLSSATLTPDLCEGLFRAYQDGRIIYNRHFGLENPDNKICCAWFNEFDTKRQFCRTREEYRENHENFSKNQIEKLAEQDVRRKAEILELENAEPEHIAERLIPAILELHQNYNMEHKDKKVSFGLVRFANINPLQKVALALLQSPIKLEDTTIHLICYHARQLLFLRSKLENTLDRLLNRKEPKSLFKEPEIIDAIKGEDKNHIFVVLGSPVCEVGRDHDYDWAVVEPSSLRSLIQLAGRVWRHRPEKVAKEANIKIFNKNIKNLRGINNNEGVFYKNPGFEKKDFYLLNAQEKSKENHSLFSNLTLNKIDGSFRLIRPKDFDDYEIEEDVFTAPNLAVLEHLVMAHLIDNSDNHISAYRNCKNILHLTADSQINTPFRNELFKKVSYTALYKEREIFWIKTELLQEIDSTNYRVNKSIFNNSFNNPNNGSKLKYNNQQIIPFLNYNYISTLADLTSILTNTELDELTEKQLLDCSTKYAVVDLRQNQVFNFDTWLGFWENT